MGHASSAAALRYQHATRERDVEIARRLDEFVAQRDSTSEQSSRDGRAMESPARSPGGTCDRSAIPLTRPNFVETMGLEPTTPCLQSRCSSQLSYVPWISAVSVGDGCGGTRPGDGGPGRVSREGVRVVTRETHPAHAPRRTMADAAFATVSAADPHHVPEANPPSYASTREFR